MEFNTLFNNTQRGLSARNTKIALRNNIFSQNGNFLAGNDVNIVADGFITDTGFNLIFPKTSTVNYINGTGDLFINPLLFDPSNADFRLTNLSAALGAANDNVSNGNF